MSHKPLRFIHDIETTGLRAEVHRIVELGSAALLGDDIISSFGSLVNCGQRHLDLCGHINDTLPHNHIPVADILAAPEDREVSERFNIWMADLVHQHQPEEVTHHSYNVRFDSAFLRLPPWKIEEWSECVMLAATHAADRIKFVKLVDAAAKYGVSFEGDAHRAEVDAKCAARVYVEILRARREIATL